METLPSIQDDLLREQQEADRDPGFIAELEKIAEQFSSLKKRVIFISRAWPLPLAEDKFNEQWSAEFAVTLAKHLKLLGFEVILDVNDLGVGVHLNSAMGTSVEKADHVLLLITKTYLYKLTEGFDTGVSIEFSFIKDKVRRMGGAKVAGERRFVLPFAFTPDLSGFPVVEGHPGFAAIFVGNVGYRKALVDLATKLYDIKSTLLKEVLLSPSSALVQAVRKCYLERRYIPRHFHEEPIPIKKGYVRLAIVKEEAQPEKTQEQFSAGGQEGAEQSGDKPKVFQDKRLRSFEEIYGTKKSVDVADIFKPDEEGGVKGKVPKRLLVLGRAGVGKSTLSHYMAYQWASADVETKQWEEDGKEKFKLVIWLKLRNLLEYPSDSILSDVIFNECIEEDHSGKKTISKADVERGIHELNPDDILYVLDGYDEVAGRENKIIRLVLKKENIFLTSRPHGANQYLTSKDAVPFDRKFENIGFLDEDIEKYILAFYGSNPENQIYIDSLIKYLRGHPNIWGIAHVPINLMLMCVSWKDSYKQLSLQKMENTTITDLYYSLIANLGRRYLDKNDVRALSDFSFEDILDHEKCRSVMSVLSRIAFEQMTDESLLIPGERLSRAQLRKQYPGLPSLREDVLQFGVLTPTSSETNKPTAEFYFVHLTFQEFLAAFHIAERLKVNDEEIKDYISINKYCPRHEMVWWFVAGLLREETECLEKFFDILEAAPRDLAKIYHQMLLMRCMDESQLKVKPKRKEIYLRNLCQLIEVGISREMAFSRTLVTYLNLSGVVFNQPEVVDKFFRFLNEKNESKKYSACDILKGQSYLPDKIIDSMSASLRDSELDARTFAVGFFRARKEVSKEIQTGIAVFFGAPQRRLRRDAINFFRVRKEVSEEIQMRIAALLADPEQSVRVTAIDFFYGRQEVLGEIQESIAALLVDPDEMVRTTVVGFFRARKKVSEEIQRSIVTLFKDASILVRQSVVSFFDRCPDASEEILRSIATWLTDLDCNVRQVAIEFFEGCKEASEETQSSIAPLLRDPEAYVRATAIKYFKVCKKVSEERQKSIASLLMDSDWGVRREAVIFFGTRQEVTEEIQDHIATLLMDSVWRVSIAAITFFDDRKEASEDIQNSIAHLLSDPEAYVRATAIRYSGSCKKVTEEIQRNIVPLLRDPEANVRAAAIGYFGVCKQVTEEIQNSIAALLRDQEADIREAAISFCCDCKEVSEEIQRSIAALLEDPLKYVRTVAVIFFCSRKEISPKIFEIVGDFLRNREANVDNIMPFIEKVTISQMMQCFQRMDKRNISREFLIVIITKLLISNLSMYQCDKTCIQVGSENIIRFASEEDLADFVRNFKRVFVDYTGFSFNSEKEKDDDHLAVRTISRVGLLPAPREIPEANPPRNPEKKAKKGCTIC